MTATIDTVRSFYDALNRGDLPAALGLLDAEVEWTEAERFPYYGGTWHGPQAIADNLFRPLSRDWEGFSATAREFIAERDRVVSLGSYSGRNKKTGRLLSASFAHVWTVRGGRIARFDMHTDTAKVLEALQRGP
ncbi:MAG TPA: nuclear transport factor 2 family protein [Candidatus Udaeobacter sp.]|nr:nuclear transport factor 2 family protein [Candidatus Udaeobacter sp.]